MRKLRYLLIVSAVILFIGLISAGNTNQYVLDKKSYLALHGTTNLNNFVCNCKEQFPARSYTLKKSSKQDIWEFGNTYLKIPVTSFDCGIRKMNTDLQNALNAHLHPNINIGLVLAEVIDDCQTDITCLDDTNNWVSVRAKTEINMNGCSKTYWLDMDLRKLNTTRLHCRGKRKLKMTDFDVTPPKVLMVKVNDAIEIEFDFIVNLL
ncbi:MAG TPA: YceI family protein [Chitinophagales bacterium]|nr:YceI family protein [Chitinophagales bacterium]